MPIDINEMSLEMLGVNPLEAELLSADEIVTRLPPDPLIDGVINQGSLAVLFGKWGTGKSFIALDWAMCIGSGQPWQGKEVRGGPVVYVAPEGSSGMGNRVRAWLQEYGTDETPQVKFYPGTINLLDEHKVDLLVKLVERDKIKLVVFDTLNRSLIGGDENSSTHMSQAIASAGKLQQAGASVLLIHHLGHAGGEPRGHSSLGGAADHMIKVWKPNDEYQLTLYSHKQKDDEPFEPIRLFFKKVQLPFGSSFVLSGERWG